MPLPNVQFSVKGAAVRLIVREGSVAFTATYPLAAAVAVLLSTRPVVELEMQADGDNVTLYLSPDAFLAALTASIQPC